MPKYTYICPEGHVQIVEESMVVNEARICDRCGKKMWRKPEAPNINWNGLRPSQGKLNPELQSLVDNEDRRRDNYLAMKEKYEKERSAHSD